MHEHGELSGHAAGDCHLLSVWGIAHGDHYAVVRVNSRFADHKAAHIFSDDDFHVDHICRGGADSRADDLAPPFLVLQFSLGRGRGIRLPVAIAHGGLGDGELGAVQDTLGNQSGSRIGDDRPIGRCHRVIPPSDKFQHGRGIPEAQP